MSVKEDASNDHVLSSILSFSLYINPLYLTFEISASEDLKSVWKVTSRGTQQEMGITAPPCQILLKASAFLVLLFTTGESIKGQARLESIYSDLSSAKCRTIEVDKETGSSTQRCQGIAGYRLLVLDDDARQSITVVTPGGEEHPLDFWGVVTHAFSSVGNKAEWRVSRSKGKVAPVALIVRVNASEDSANPSRLTSYLAVVKVTPEKICVTHKIPPGLNANENARHAADNAQTAACLKEVSP